MKELIDQIERNTPSIKRKVNLLATDKISDLMIEKDDLEERLDKYIKEKRKLPLIDILNGFIDLNKGELKKTTIGIMKTRTFHNQKRRFSAISRARAGGVANNASKKLGGSRKDELYEGKDKTERSALNMSLGFAGLSKYMLNAENQKKKHYRKRYAPSHAEEILLEKLYHEYAEELPFTSLLDEMTAKEMRKNARSHAVNSIEIAINNAPCILSWDKQPYKNEDLKKCSIPDSFSRPIGKNEQFNKPCCTEKLIYCAWLFRPCYMKIQYINDHGGNNFGALNKVVDQWAKYYGVDRNHITVEKIEPPKINQVQE